jgi:hypothetical protein
MQTFQFEEKVKAEFANLNPFQILVVCSDALVHFSSQNNQSSWIQFRITQSSPVSSRQLQEHATATLFSDLMIKSFDDYNDPMEVVKRSKSQLIRNENNVGERTKQATAPEPAKFEESIVSTAADGESNSLQAAPESSENDTQLQVVKQYTSFDNEQELATESTLPQSLEQEAIAGASVHIENLSKPDRVASHAKEGNG